MGWMWWDRWRSWIFDEVLERSLRGHHRSLFWGDRLLTLDKAMGFLEDPRFRSAASRVVGVRRYDGYRSPDGVTWRLATLVWAARSALALEGDFVEAGVFCGDMSAVVLDTLDFARLPRTAWLYDTFEGIVEDMLEPGELAPAYLSMAQALYRQPGLYPRVVRRFQEYPNVRVVQGPTPASLEQQGPERVAFLHLDLNCAAAERGVLEALWERAVPGALVVFDDYGWLDFERQRLSHDQWARERGLAILELPTGQGLLVKPPR